MFHHWQKTSAPPSGSLTLLNVLQYTYNLCHLPLLVDIYSKKDDKKDEKKDDKKDDKKDAKKEEP